MFGWYSIRPHATDRMDFTWHLDEADIDYVLTFGRCTSHEYKNGEWTYRIEARGYGVVVAWEEDMLVIVTTWK